MNKYYVGQRLSKNDDYVRPKRTKTEMVQNEKNINDYLKNFEEIDNNKLPYININTQLRYISYDIENECELFRFGGLLMKVEEKYIVLAGKDGKRFSVQRYIYDNNNNNNKLVHTTRFFKKIKNEEILKEQLSSTFNKSEEIIKKQNKIIEKQKKELEAMKKKLNK
tara:strand:+ start:27 stop:524 length:498 start_codon:yes stop_codon:yes gene_type:complete